MKRLLTLMGLLCSIGVVASGQQTTVEIVNGTDASLFFLYASPEAASSWGLDRLGDTVMAPGASIALSIESAPRYDVRAIDENDREIVVWGWQPNGTDRLVLRANSSGDRTTELASMGWLDIINDTNYEIAEIYVVSSGAVADMTDNLLDDARLRLAERYRLRLAPEAVGSLLVDVILIDVDGDRYVRRGVDLETATELRFTLSDLAVE